jgi:hypothetical protein
MRTLNGENRDFSAETRGRMDEAQELTAVMHRMQNGTAAGGMVSRKMQVAGSKLPRGLLINTGALARCVASPVTHKTVSTVYLQSMLS